MLIKFKKRQKWLFLIVSWLQPMLCKFESQTKHLAKDVSYDSLLRLKRCHDYLLTVRLPVKQDIKVITAHEHK